jgi:hypothetical protein
MNVRNTLGTLQEHTFPRRRISITKHACAAAYSQKSVAWCIHYSMPLYRVLLRICSGTKRKPFHRV